MTMHTRIVDDLTGEVLDSESVNGDMYYYTVSIEYYENSESESLEKRNDVTLQFIDITNAWKYLKRFSLHRNIKTVQLYRNTWYATNPVAKLMTNAVYGKSIRWP